MGSFEWIVLLAGPVFFIIWGCIWGKVTNALIHSKGYYSQNWFWWGFFFSVAAVAVAAFRPENPDQDGKAGYTSHLTNAAEVYEKEDKGMLDVPINKGVGPDTWQCVCGRKNMIMAYRCSECGLPKDEALHLAHTINTQKKNADSASAQIQKFENMKKLQARLDNGEISQAEFEELKKEYT